MRSIELPDRPVPVAPARVATTPVAGNERCTPDGRRYYAVGANPLAPESRRGVGRNAPCPCGAMRENGRAWKFKHCCGRNRRTTAPAPEPVQSMHSSGGVVLEPAPRVVR